MKLKGFGFQHRVYFCGVWFHGFFDISTGLIFIRIFLWFNLMNGSGKNDFSKN